VQLLQSASVGLPQQDTGTVSDYEGKLELEAISQPTLGVGVDRFGAYAGGGVSFLFADFLNDHMFGATIQSTSRIQETGGQAVWNRKHRWNWIGRRHLRPSPGNE
jgi:hypothetical protein